MTNFETQFLKERNMEDRYSKENLLLLVPESELKNEPSRSSGPGGQNVDKRETAVRLRWSPEWNHNLTEEERQRVEERLRDENDMKARLRRSRKQRFDYQYTDNTDEGKLLIGAHEERYQERNWQKAMEKFYALLEEALRPEPKRKPPRTGSPALRLEEKRKIKQRKEFRKKPARPDFE
jgi:ribosome-associated protein